MLAAYLADSIHILHYAVVLSVLFSFLVPAGEWLKYQVILICLLLLDWNDHDGQCALTALEAKLRGTWRPGGGAEGDDRPAFWYPMIKRLGLNISRLAADRLNYFLFLVSLLVCFIRFCAFKKVSLAPTGRAGRMYGGVAVLLGSLWAVNQAWQVPPAKTHA